MTKIVTGAAVVLNIGGESRYLYRGSPVPTGADKGDLEHLTSLGLIADESTPAGDDAIDNALAEPSTAWTVEQLRTFADGKQIDLGKARSKVDLVAAIKEARPITDPTVVVVQAPATPATPGEPSGETEPATVDPDGGETSTETGSTPAGE